MSSIKQVLSMCFNYFFKKMGQTRPLFVYFRSFHMTNIAQILQMKKRRWHAWARTQGGRMVGADESTELWRHPCVLIIKFDLTMDLYNRLR